VHIEENRGDRGGFEVAIAYERDGIDDAVFCIGFMDESGTEVAVAVSPPLRLGADHSKVQCVIDPFPLRAGIYFPIVGILSADGLVRDRWQLDRAIVVEGDDSRLADDFGPVEIPAVWCEP
jgi:hypothetical protein